MIKVPYYATGAEIDDFCDIYRKAESLASDPYPTKGDIYSSCIDAQPTVPLQEIKTEPEDTGNPPVPPPPTASLTAASCKTESETVPVLLNII
jgi:hypothetical protein